MIKTLLALLVLFSNPTYSTGADPVYAERSHTQMTCTTCISPEEMQQINKEFFFTLSLSFTAICLVNLKDHLHGFGLNEERCKYLSHTLLDISLSPWFIRGLDRINLYSDVHLLNRIAAIAALVRGVTADLNEFLNIRANPHGQLIFMNTYRSLATMTCLFNVIYYAGIYTFISLHSSQP